MNKNLNRGSTLVATGTVITALFTVITGFIAYTFNDKVNQISTVQASVTKLETDTIPDLKTRTALSEKDIQYIKSGIDDIKTALKIKSNGN